MIIQVNTKVCKPEIVEWSDGHPKTFELNTQFGKITGMIGLMKEGSQRWLYGFDLFRKGRMIRTYQKFAIREHPMHARIMGEIHLDFVPVTHEKNRFIEDSEEYETCEKTCRESELFRQIQKEAEKKGTKDTITKQVQEKTGLWEDYLAKAYKDNDLKSIINPNVKIKDEKSSDKDLGDNLKDNSGKEQNVEVEKRNHDDEPERKEQKEPESTRNRTPKETHEVIRHTVTIFGKTFKFKHDWIYDSGLGRKDWKIDDKEGILIFTNTAFPAFIATVDQPFYAAMNICEAIAEVYAKESNVGIKEMNEAKDLALKKAAEFKNQLEEDKVSKEKKEKRTTCELCGTEIDFKSSLTKYCAECSTNKMKEIQKKYYNTPEIKEKIRIKMKEKYDSIPREKREEIKKRNMEEMFNEYLEEIKSRKED